MKNNRKLEKKENLTGKNRNNGIDILKSKTCMYNITEISKIMYHIYILKHCHLNFHANVINTSKRIVNKNCSILGASGNLPRRGG